MRALLAVGALPGSERRRLVLSVALAAGATGAAIALLATSGYLISRAAQRPQVIALMVTIVAVRSFGIARAGLRYAERLTSHELALRQLARLRSTFFSRLAPLVPGQLQRHGRGELLARFVGDVDTISDLYLRVLIPALVSAGVIVGSAIAGWLMLSTLGIVLAVALVLDAVASAWLADRVGGAATRRQAATRAELTGRLIEAIDGSAELALAGQSRAANQSLGSLDRRLARLAGLDARASALSSAAHGLLSGAGLLAVLVVGVAGVRHGGLSGLLLAAAVFLCLGARETIAPLPRAAQRARACAQAARRLLDITARAPEIADPDRPALLSGHGRLAAEAMTLAYGPRETPVLRDLEFHLDAGERVALTGASGSGKTTLAELLVRFRDPQRGRVTLEGVDARDITQDQLRSAVLLCGQDAHLFNTSVLANLLIGNPQADHEQVWGALRTVELETWAACLPHGLDTLVGQHGEMVSGGQRQRLALARALLSPARFLILDEPLAHLDAPLAARLLPRMLEHCGDRGVLVITHDTEALPSFDRILDLADGRLTERVLTAT
jgi:ATP-binding cassette, subfamily C, bacterial CydC